MTLFNFYIKVVLCSLLLSVAVAGQSRDQNYPTGVASSEVSGTIKARDIGDSRLTSYFYAFDGSQGDVFVNVVTRNFSGDVDVFVRDSLRPLTKMVILGSAGQQVETGRVIYLRKPERLILRIQGRTPNDEPATFQIKFAGSFVAVNERPAVDEPTITREETAAESTVNSVGTIMSAPRKASPLPVERVEPPRADARKAGAEVSPLPKATSKTSERPEDAKRPEVVVKSSIKPPTTARPAPPRRTAATKKAAPAKEPPAPDPLASISLRIELKEGGEILKPLNEVLRFTVDKGVLTVIMKTGGITRYSMVTEVSKVTIE